MSGGNIVLRVTVVAVGGSPEASAHGYQKLPAS